MVRFNREDGICFVKKSIRRYFKEHRDKSLEDVRVLYSSYDINIQGKYCAQCRWEDEDDLLSEVEYIYNSLKPRHIWIEIFDNDDNGDLICEFNCD